MEFILIADKLKHILAGVFWPVRCAWALTGRFPGFDRCCMSIYKENGFDTRVDYLIDLADNYGIDQSIVFAMADMLGKNEDFDGLINTLEDIQLEGGF